MEFYVIGAVFIVAGFGLKALAARRGWIKEQRARRTAIDVIVITLASVAYMFSLILFLGLIALYEFAGVPPRVADGAAWLSTLVVVIFFCTWLGWQVGDGPRRRVHIPASFDEDPENPFGAPDTPHQEY